uniref:Uncharacterized protein n=1 Tax=Amphora coffeiformis TaxID=265554 RepID=A0A7S3L1U6_9STRA
MKHLISSAISLTNQGTDKLATGEYFAAASAFCRAIKITQLLSEQAAKNKKAAASSIAATLSYEALPVLLADVSCNNEIAIFEHCFIVVLKHDVDDDDSSSSSSLLWTKETVTTQQCQVFTAALIYNLALTYHYGGVCGNSRERMNDALQLYAKAIDFLPDPTKDDDDDDEEEEDWSKEEEEEEEVDVDTTLSTTASTTLSTTAAASMSPLVAPQPDEDEEEPSPPLESDPPAVWLTYYQYRLRHSREWTERANYWYAVGNCHVQLRDYQAATAAFEQEAALLKRRGAPPAALTPIYKSLAKLWTVRQPTTALRYYEQALKTCRTNNDVEERQHIRLAMGRLYFCNGNLERAMQVSIVGSMPK